MIDSQEKFVLLTVFSQLAAYFITNFCLEKILISSVANLQRCYSITTLSHHYYNLTLIWRKQPVISGKTLPHLFWERNPPLYFGKNLPHAVLGRKPLIKLFRVGISLKIIRPVHFQSHYYTTTVLPDYSPGLRLLLNSSDLFQLHDPY